jgi:hypothetical protein
VTGRTELLFSKQIICPPKPIGKGLILSYGNLGEHKVQNGLRPGNTGRLSIGAVVTFVSSGIPFEPIPRMGLQLTSYQRRELGSTGIMVSPLSFGAAPLGNEYGNIDVSKQVKYIIVLASSPIPEVVTARNGSPFAKQDF